jgi:hypothetical protein
MKLIHLAAAVFVTAALSFAQEPAAVATAAAPAQAKFAKKSAPYPLTTCVVSGEELDGDAVSFEVEGRTVKTCCEKCQAKVEKDPAKYVAKLDEAVVAAQLPTYALKTCVISGKELGSMGDPVKLVLDGTLVQLCCKGCTKKATVAGVAMADKVRAAAYAAQAANYALKTCVVSGEDLDDEPTETMFGTTLVRTCCKKCAAKVEKDPAKFLAKLAKSTKQGEHGEHGDGEHGGVHGKETGGEHGKKGEKAKKGSGDSPSDESCCSGGECCKDGEAKSTAKTGSCCDAAKAKGAEPKPEAKSEPKPAPKIH